MASRVAEERRSDRAKKSWSEERRKSLETDEVESCSGLINFDDVSDVILWHVSTQRSVQSLF